jgi:formylmethanofuran dehydrogenase subunit E
MKMHRLETILMESAKGHARLCPRQVLGARMGLLGAEVLQIEVPNLDKRLLVIAETDGCAVDGLSAATGCRVGNRTLRINDLGKVAAIFIDVMTEEMVRIAPRPEARKLASEYSPKADNRWEAMLSGYQVMPAADLFKVQRVRLVAPISQIISQPGRKTICEACGEEVLNGREMTNNGKTLCRTCAGESYFQSLPDFQVAVSPEQLPGR